MFVKAIKDYDKFSDEADIIVSDGKYDLLCYCHPTEKPIIGEPIKKITSFFAKSIMRATKPEFIIEKLKDCYSYYLQGKLIDIASSKICIGNLIMCLDSVVPKDVKCGEFVSFFVDRLDCKF